MYKVKIITGKNSDNIFRQLPGGKNISKDGKYEFFVDEDIKDPDFLVVRNKYIHDPVTYHVAPENTLLLISEPYSVIHFPHSYCKQFGMMSTCQVQDKGTHKNMVMNQAALPWFVGINDKGATNPKYNLTYDTMKSGQFPEKTKLLSVISSNKAFTQGHQDRIEFVKKLKERYGDQVDVFGRGINNFEDKWDVLAPYKYHISIENSASDYYWTEKLSDCYLAGTFPIYYGCTNISDFFPKESYEAIDIHNAEAAFKTIDAIIANNRFETAQTALQQSKELVLDKYNFFDLIVDCLETMNANAPKQDYTIKPAKTMLDAHNFYMFVIERNLFKLKQAFKKGK